MANFFYKAKKHNGEIVSGSIRANDVEDAAQKLEQKSLNVLEITISEYANNNSFDYHYNKISKDTIFTVKEKIEFFNSFYYLYKSGLSIIQIFSSMMQSTNNGNIKGLCRVILGRIEKGYSLVEAFSGYEPVIGLAYTRLITAGEASGELDSILLKMIQNIKREEELKSNLISSLTYPIILFCLAIAVFLFFKFFVLKVFSMMGMGLCQFAVLKLMFIAILKIIFLFGIVFGFVFYVYFNKKLLKKFLNFCSKFPIFRAIIKNYSFSNFFSVLALSYDAGVPVIQGFELANSVINIASVKAKINSAIRRMKSGCEVTTAIMAAKVFSSFATSQISSGEKAGEMGKMFAVVAHDYEKQIELSMKVLSKVLEPTMIIFAGIMVLYVASTAYKSFYSNLLNSF